MISIWLLNDNWLSKIIPKCLTCSLSGNTAPFISRLGNWSPWIDEAEHSIAFVLVVFRDNLLFWNQSHNKLSSELTDITNEVKLVWARDTTGSSANNVVFKVFDTEGRSLIYTRNRIGLPTDPSYINLTVATRSISNNHTMFSISQITTDPR